MNRGDLAAQAIARGALQDERELRDLISYLQTQRWQDEDALEIGVHTGGTLWLWRQLCFGRVLGVDIASPPCEHCDERRAHQNCRRRQLTDNQHGCHLIRGDSKARSVVDSVKRMLPAGVDLLHIDGGHDFDTVRADVDNYHPFVRPGRGVMIVHDIAPIPGWGVHELWSEDLSRHPHAFAIQEPTGYGIGVVPC